jgi:hypothetical protein
MNVHLAPLRGCLGHLTPIPQADRRLDAGQWRPWGAHAEAGMARQRRVRQMAIHREAQHVPRPQGDLMGVNSQPTLGRPLRLTAPPGREGLAWRP